MISWGFMKYKADAEICYREIQSLGKEVTPQMIVDFARDEDTELHKCFQWDDSVAAENWRKQQARQVVMSLTVKVERSEHGEAQTYRLIEHDDTEKIYRPVVFTVRNKDEYARLLAQAKADMIAFKKRYKSIVELQEVIEEIDKIING
ncbi:MAG: hypothetical protein IKF05_00380 [Erysipelotrichaceae bacterium]|nr:hypothetical protein [Erysipelotrichaceae bacterium]MBR3036447.1 hypothetical protein [Lachnospiraceae bacterium]